MSTEGFTNLNLLNESDLDAGINTTSNLLFDHDNLEDLIKTNDPSIQNTISSQASITTNNQDCESNNLLLESDIKNPNSSINLPSTQYNKTVNWKDEVFKGNFMPAFVLLDKKVISVDQIVDNNTNNTLLHLSLSFSFTNVTRGLIEIFKGSLNLKNAYGHTPLHILCTNEQKDIFIFSYIIKNEDLLLDEKDKTGVTPLFFSIISKHNFAFLMLLYKKADIYNIDEMGNNALYFTLSSDNKFSLNFILRHAKKLSLNNKYFGNKASLCDVLITNRDRKITKHLIKYFHHNLDLESIVGSLKNKNDFNFYNNYNYDLFNTLYFYKTKSYFSFINKLFTRNPMGNYTYKYYNFKFLIHDLILPNMNENTKYFCILIYCCFISHLFFTYLNSSNILTIDNNTSYFSQKFLILAYQTSSIVCMFLSFFKFFFTKTLKKKTCYNNEVKLSVIAESIPYYSDLDEIENNSNNNGGLANSRNNQDIIKEPYYDYLNCEHNSDNVLNILFQAVERNPIDIFFEEEFCEICLIKKDKSTNHCHVCNRCVKEFYFHSKLFNVCFHRRNISYYIMFYSSIMAIHLSFIYFLVYKISNDASKLNNPEKDFVDIPLSLYQSEQLFTNIFIFLINLDLTNSIFLLMNIIGSVLFFQNWMVMLICLGFKVSYNNMFRMHKKAVGKLEKRQNTLCNIPQVNTVSICEFVKNLFKK